MRYFIMGLSLDVPGKIPQFFDEFGTRLVNGVWIHGFYTLGS